MVLGRYLRALNAVLGTGLYLPHPLGTGSMYVLLSAILWP